MATFKNFDQLEVWQEARSLVRETYAISNKGSFSRDFGLREQVRKSGVSIMSNIAEGFDRNGTAEFVQFLAVAKGSVAELRSQLYVAADQGYINKESFEQLSARAVKTGRMIGGLMNYLRRSGMRGTKYK